MSPQVELKDYIRDIPDFPKKGIIFKDITTLLQDNSAFSEAINELSDKFKDKKIDAVVAVDARGFIFGGAVAYKLGVGFVPVRKKGKLPYKANSVTYDLEYGTDTLEMHEDAVKPGQKVLIIDDLLATGGTVSAAAELIKKSGAEIVGIGFLIELAFLKGIEKLKSYPVYSLIKY
ncbi:MAG: adenine phosphoribosyltransferase [Candidatus Omnitrophota bacterium]